MNFMEIDPLIRVLGHDETSGTADLVEQGAKIFIAFSGGYLTDESEEFSRGLGQEVHDIRRCNLSDCLLGNDVFTLGQFEG